MPETVLLGLLSLHYLFLLVVQMYGGGHITCVMIDL